MEPAKAEAREIEALAEAHARRSSPPRAPARPTPSRLRGMAEAEAMVAKADAWGKYSTRPRSPTACSRSCRELAAAVVGAALQDREDRDDRRRQRRRRRARTRSPSDVTKIVAELPEVLEALTGKRLDELVKALPGGGNGGRRPSACPDQGTGFDDRRTDEAAHDPMTCRTPEPRGEPGRARARSGARRPDGGLQVHRPAGHLAAHLASRSTPSTRGVRGGPRVRRLLDPRLPGDLGVGHGPDAGPGHRGDRPVPRAEDDVDHLQRLRPDHPRAVLARPALCGAEGRGLPARDRHRRHVLHGARRRSSSSSSTWPSTSRPNTAFYEVDSRAGVLEPRRRASATGR